MLSRLFEPLCARLERHDAAVAVVQTRLRLVTRETHVRTVSLPTPIRDPRCLRTLVLLDLESHPPTAGIDQITLSVEPAPGRVVQCSLLARAEPAPEQLSTLLARLIALMGGGRCGAASLVDSHRSGAFEMRPFDPNSHQPSAISRRPTRVAVLRRFRIPLAVRVRDERGRPVRMIPGDRGIGGGTVARSAGPWRTSGHWWTPQSSVVSHQSSVESWDHDEWDVALSDGGVYRIYRDRAHGGWFLAGVVD